MNLIYSQSGTNLPNKKITFQMHHLHVSPEPWCTCACSFAGLAERVILASTDLATVATEGIDGTGPVTVVASIARLAYTAPRPGVAPEKGAENRLMEF